MHILLVEDEHNFGTVMRDYLEMNGFVVSWAKDGVEGWDQYQSGNFALCILDVMMPKKDGFALAQDIRKSQPDQPLLFVTARAMKEDVIRGFKLGADDYIIKPFDPEELLYRIRAIPEPKCAVKAAGCAGQAV
ncbi:MAG: response regulator [Bacteroidia bacterium]